MLKKKNVINRPLDNEPSVIIKKDYINPKWSTESYAKGFTNKIFIYLSKIFFFLKKIDFLREIVRKIKHKLIVIKINKKLKKYFS